MRQYYLDWPKEVSIETYAKCNAACTFCPYTTLERIGAKMPDEMIERIVEELKDHPYPFILSPFKINEPLLDKRLLGICRMINAELPKAHLRLFTNGSPLTEKYIDGFAQLERVAHLWISLNDHRADEYRALMNLDFERTAANLDLLHVKVAVGDFPHPVVISRVRETMAISDDDKAFRAYVNERWPRFDCHLIKPDGWLGEIPRGSDLIPDAPCGRWYELSIMATGKVALCCMDSSGRFEIGDIRDGVFQVYNSPNYRERRVKNLSRSGISPCDTCSY